MTSAQKELYKDDFPDEGNFNWKTVEINMGEKHYYTGCKINGVLLHDGNFCVNGVIFFKGQFKIIDEKPIKDMVEGTLNTKTGDWTFDAENKDTMKSQFASMKSPREWKEEEERSKAMEKNMKTTLFPTPDDEERIEFVRKFHMPETHIPEHWTDVMKAEAVKIDEEYRTGSGAYSDTYPTEVELYELFESEGVIGPPASKLIDKLIEHYKNFKTGALMVELKKKWEKSQEDAIRIGNEFHEDFVVQVGLTKDEEKVIDEVRKNVKTISKDCFGLISYTGFPSLAEDVTEQTQVDDMVLEEFPNNARAHEAYLKTFHGKAFTLAGNGYKWVYDAKGVLLETIQLNVEGGHPSW